jgi:hypothetical protein
MDPAPKVEAPESVTAGGEEAPFIQSTVDGVHYHFPVEITVMRTEGVVDVEVIADRVLEKLARQVEQLERERAGRR